MNIKRRRGGAPSDWLKEINQEDLLAEIAERLQLELNSTGMSVETFSEKLGRPSEHAEMLLEGLVDISVRELADVFSVFDKIVALNLICQKKPILTVERDIEAESKFSKIEISWTTKNNAQFRAKLNISSPVKLVDQSPIARDVMCFSDNNDWVKGLLLGNREKNELEIQ